MASPSEWDSQATLTPQTDAFCSASDWSLAAYRSQGGSARLVSHRGPNALAHFLCLESVFGERILLPLETLWGFGAQILGTDLSVAFREAIPALVAKERPTRLVLTGLPSSEAEIQTLQAVAESCNLGMRLFDEPVQRHVLHLGTDYNSWFARRRTHFRSELRRCERRAHELNVHFEHTVHHCDAHDATRLFERLLSAEQKSWKGKQNCGFGVDPLLSFYRQLWIRLCAEGRAITVFARKDEEDIAFLFGGRLGPIFRGLQLGADEGYRKLSLGHLVQLKALRAHAESGGDLYDLGMVLPYKAEFADRVFTTHSALLWRLRH